MAGDSLFLIEKYRLYLSYVHHVPPVVIRVVGHMSSHGQDENMNRFERNFQLLVDFQLSSINFKGLNIEGGNRDILYGKNLAP
jgi:hypothetical protein